MPAVITNILTFLIIPFMLIGGDNKPANEFQGKATYISKSRLELGTWGARMSEARKKQIAARLKNRLEKEFVLVFNKEESLFIEQEQLDAISGATDSWGKNFAAGENYKNVKSDKQIQQQEFYGKKFLVKDQLQPMTWTLGNETKKLGITLVLRLRRLFLQMICCGILFLGRACAQQTTQMRRRLK